MRADWSMSVVGAFLLLAVADVRAGSSASSRMDPSVRPKGVLLFADYRGSPATGIGKGVPSLYRMDADGTSRRPLHGRFYVGETPDWSPNGQRIVFTRWLETEDSRSSRFGLDIVVAAANGAAPGILIGHSDEWTWPTAPRWSPDGRRIAFINTGPTHENEIFITDTRSAPFKAGRGVAGTDGAGSVSWSPSGTELTFDGASGVYRISVKGGTPRLLVRHAHSPSWSPDGRRIAYVANRGGLYLLDLQTRRSRLVTHTCGGAVEWSPDGHWLAFTDCSHPVPGVVGRERYDLSVVKTDGTARHVIFTNRAGIGLPSWR